MMRLLLPYSALVVLLLAGCTASLKTPINYPAYIYRPMDLDLDELPERIAFGSCGHQLSPMPVLTKAIEQDLDLFIYLGDNIYGDTKDMNVMKAKYLTLAQRPEHKALREHCPVLATWDDHDYGDNDGGRHYSMKEASKEVFLEFWAEPKNSPRRSHLGIYHSLMFEDDGKRLQLIFTDNRTFRDDLLPNNKGVGQKNDYRPNPSPDSTFLGAEQWKWLEEQLRQPADVRIVCTSTQFAHEYNGYESWTNVPREQERFIELIRKTEAGGVMFISGDVHWGELSCMKEGMPYPLYDVTSSGITQTWPTTEDNKYRVGEVVPENHFGTIEIDWKVSDPVITYRIIDVTGKVRVKHSVPLSTLQVRKG